MLKKRGGRKAQIISIDFITAFTLYFIAFSIFSYFIFSIEGEVFTQKSFLKDTHYDFDTFEENARQAGVDFGSNFHLSGSVLELEDFDYETLKQIALNNTEFESEIGAVDICIYLTDSTENTYLNAGPNSDNITLTGQKCGGALFDILSPFPECGEIYSQGFSAARIYFYNETKRTARLVVHFCRR